jgi:hypothetical protein
MAHSLVRVTLIDVATGEMFGRSDLPIDQLPASFEASTTLHLGNQDWHVEKAEPMTADEFGRTGELTLTLRKVAYLDPKKILFTIPTLENTILQPDAHFTAAGHRIVEIHEDDWRQIEFVSARFAPEIEAELADIATIFREFSVDNGQFVAFRQVHMRERIPSPLDLPLALDDVRTLLGATGMPLGVVSFQRMPGIVLGSFAFQAGDLVVYGAGEPDALRCLCIHQQVSTLLQPMFQGVQRLMSTRKLYLVDWCRMTALAPNDTASLSRYFASK